MIDRVEVLRHCPVLAGFTDVGLKLLAAVARERFYSNAQQLQTQGETPREQALLFIASGRVRCEVRTSEGTVLGLGTLGVGEHLGAMRLFGEAVSPVTAVAEGSVTVLTIDRPSFERLRIQKPQAAMKLLFALSSDFGQRMGECSQLFADFAAFAAQRANIQERGTFASYADLGLDHTPTLKSKGE